MMLRNLLLACSLVLVTAAGLPAQADIEDDASTFVEDRGETLLDIMALPAGQDRRGEFETWLTDAFNLPKLAGLALGPYQNVVTGEQLEAYDAAFSEYIVVTYEARFDTFTGYDFSVQRTRPMNDDEAVVRTNIAGPGGELYIVDFRVQENDDGRLQVIDIAVEGLSMLKTQRDEFGAVIQRDGVDGLIESLRERSEFVAATSE